MRRVQVAKEIVLELSVSYELVIGGAVLAHRCRDALGADP
jgi:hypothetical protein